MSPPDVLVCSKASTCSQASAFGESCWAAGEGSACVILYDACEQLWTLSLRDVFGGVFEDVFAVVLGHGLGGAFGDVFQNILVKESLGMSLRPSWATSLGTSLGTTLGMSLDGVLGECVWGMSWWASLEIVQGDVVGGIHGVFI